MTADGDKYSGTIKLLKDGPYRDILCDYKFNYENKNSPGIN